ncbi:MAG TPA: GNAT family N-acetyltransferase [Terriglobales bacterium]|nr:GNAT family N-acetyltransferase [Terriglobales bacterium]
MGVTLAGMDIRRAVPEDAEAISTLIKSVAHYFTLNPQGGGAGAFFQSIEPEAIRGYITAPSFLYYAGLLDQQLAGVVAVRNTTHLYHLFVGKPFQERGLGRQLWQHAKEAAIAAGNRAGFTVNSTPHAAHFYQRFGFQATGPRIEMHGIAFIPMKLRLKATE